MKVLISDYVTKHERWIDISECFDDRDVEGEVGYGHYECDGVLELYGNNEHVTVIMAPEKAKECAKLINQGKAVDLTEYQKVTLVNPCGDDRKLLNKLLEESGGEYINAEIVTEGMRYYVRQQ